MSLLKKLLPLYLFLVSAELRSWSKEGHYLVAEVARHYLKPSVLDSVQHYLGDITLEQASDWMDDVRKEPGHAYLNTWHYINIEKDKTYVISKSPDLINRLDLAVYSLKTNRGDAAGSLFYIKVLMHLIGDLHQPLHIGYGADRGGNDIEVDYFGRRSNLHRVWDDLIIKSAKIEGETCLHYLNVINKEQTEKFDGNSFLNWAMESRALLTSVYDLKNNTIDQNYVDRSAVLIEKQLLKAGIRLASVLNSIYSG